ncbi:MAG: hypothetical protein GY832_26435 [Chloroflexi bacterium]|nr:hypothetical protein [Chloroflexota bacterium]
MGTEYKGRLGSRISFQVINHLLDEIANVPIFVEIEDQQSQEGLLLLRFAECEERAEWVEDLLVKLTETECYVLFHIGSREMEKKAVSIIESILTQAGSLCVLEELRS